MFRNSENTEKVEYISYSPNYFFNENPGNGNTQKKSNIRFYVNTTDEINPIDWYNAYFDVNFKINKLADGTDFKDEDGKRGTLAGDAYSLINKFDVNFNGGNVISLNNINQCVSALNMLQFSNSYVNGLGTQSFSYPKITSINRPENTDTEFKKKASFTNDGKIEQSNILLNRYPFFDSFKDNLCPLGKMEIIIDIEKDDVLMWIQENANINANKGRVIITKFNLWVPKLKFSDLGRKNYFNKIINPQKWTFNKISYAFQVNTTAIQGIFNISNLIKKPRYVFLWALRSVKYTGDYEQNYNPFIYNNYNLGGDNGTISCTSAQLIAGNDNLYPIQPLNPTNQLNTMYKKAFDLIFNGNLLTGTFMTKDQYKRFYPLFVFDLSKQENLKAKLELDFIYTLSGPIVGEQYSWRAMIISEGEISVDNLQGNATISMN